MASTVYEREISISVRAFLGLFSEDNILHQMGFFVFAKVGKGGLSRDVERF